MPYVRIDIIKRDLKKKRELAKAVIQAVVTALGTAPEKVHVIINEITRDQHAIGGVLNLDSKRKGTKRTARK
jgi:4-oxalocrotonate tautomerase